MELLSQLHPPMVHFAIALVMIGVFFDIAGFVLKKDHLKHAGFWTIVFGMLAVWGAAFTGHQAEELVEEAIKGTAAYELLEKHEEIGEILPWAVTVLGLLRIYLFFKSKDLLFIVYLIAGIVVAGVIGLQGRIGGKLVYEHGVGVKGKGVQIQEKYHNHEDEE
ncbi:MAG TPA: DUF2231 domain-containing protein [Persephonella sp.]|uniref:DUF2231 domain-containing protein n=1 Tax=Persephonella marina (strain DSM 14350 / EX-H1) TaxID=123214 RepID=C0QPS1_PERMH|nr:MULTISPECIES: DUF2231 domain-containing protein [Persephonella]ACO04741.1 conserved hypothetical protein [Persephonella marina EX-H1]HCB69718.1 DUF2231 domain-containing protein [Persephonella sp.]